AAAVYEDHIGNPERAFRSYERILSCDPMDARAARALVPLYEGDEKWARLPALYELVLADAANEEEALVWFDKLVRVTAGRRNERGSAVNFARQAFATYPGSSAARELLEQACKDAGKWEPLVEALEARVTELRASAASSDKGRRNKKTNVTAQGDLRALELELAQLFEERLH